MPAKPNAKLVIKTYHKRIKGSEKFEGLEGLSFATKGGRFIIGGHTASNVDVEISIEGAALMELIKTYAENTGAKK